MSAINPDEIPFVPGVKTDSKAGRHLSALVYPSPYFDRQNLEEVMQVDPSGLAEYDIDLNMSVDHVSQPTCVNAIEDLSVVPSMSVYTVTAPDGSHVAAKAWRQYGGKIKVTVNPDTTTARVTILGPTLPYDGAFQIGFVMGEVTFPSLFLVGTGVAIMREGITIQSGLVDDQVDDTAAVLDNPFIQTLERAYDAAHGALAKHMGDFQTLSLNVAGVGGIDGVDPNRPETAIGRTAGARVFFDFGWYRVRTSSITPAGAALTCEQDTTFADFAAVTPPGFSFADFDRLHAGERFRDFDSAPLRMS